MKMRKLAVISLVCIGISFNFFCSEKKKEELKIYSMDEFSIMLIDRNMFGKLIYDLDVYLNVDREKFSTKFKYLKLKNYPLRFRECAENECSPEHRGVSPRQFRSMRPEESILLQSKDYSLFIYEKFGYLYVEGIFFNNLSEDNFRVCSKNMYRLHSKVYKDLLSLVKEKGVEREFMDVLVYSDEKIEPNKAYYTEFLFVVALLAIIVNGFALGLHFLKEDENSK
jgi:hypothetical protein